MDQKPPIQPGTPNTPGGETPRVDASANGTVRKFSKDAPVIRTFSSDLADAVQHNQMSVIKVAMAEQKRRSEEAELQSPQSKTNRRFISYAVLFIIIGLVAVYGTYLYKNKKAAVVVVPTETKIPQLLPSDVSLSIETGNGESEAIVSLIRAAIKNTEVKDGGLAQIYFTNALSGEKRLVSTQTFLTMIESQIPAPLARNLSDRFMLGMINTANVHHPFLILQPADYETALPNMLEWETKLYNDFYLPFSLSGNESTFATKFGDILLKNKNVRVLRNQLGTPVLLYGFLDEHTILITENTDIFTTVADKWGTLRPH